MKHKFFLLKIASVAFMLNIINMLFGNFYYASQQTTHKGYLKALIEFNDGHSIFKGHFPDQPVVPGVCMMRLVHEMLQRVVEQPLRLTKAGELKFLHMIAPQLHPKVWLEIKFQNLEIGIDVQASLFWEQIIFFKGKAFFNPVVVI